MYVPNYIPEPLEVPGNVALDAYSAKVDFIRNVTWKYGLSVGLCGVLAAVPLSQLNGASILIALVVLLLTLDVLRIRMRGKTLEAKVSSFLLPGVIALVGFGSRFLIESGWPLWSIGFGMVAMLVYTVLCGRDFSFVGCFALSAPPSCIAAIAFSRFMRFSPILDQRIIGINLVFLCYVCYDLASILARRRKGETWAAVVDLYRDVFNFVGYFRRCLQHWRKHRIWLTPK